MTAFCYIYTCIANFTDVDTPDLGSGALWVWRFESFPRYSLLNFI